MIITSVLIVKGIQIFVATRVGWNIYKSVNTILKNNKTIKKEKVKTIKG